LLVAVHDGSVRRRRWPELEAVDEVDVRGAACPQCRAEAAKVRLVEAIPVDHSRWENVNRDTPGAGEHGAVELLPRFRVDLLRVVQEPERSRSVVAHAGQVEHYAGDDERAREGPSAGLVGSCDEPTAQLAIERKQLPAGSLHHASEDSGG